MLPAAKPAGGDPVQAARVMVLAREFEAVLLGQMAQLMFQGLGQGGPLGGGPAEAQWRGLLTQEYGKAMAAKGGIGLASRVEQEIRAAIERQAGPAALNGGGGGAKR